jgi:two-component system NtrC family sensor kinase
MDVEFVEHLKTQWMAMIDALEDPLVLIDQDFNIHRQNRAYFEMAANPNHLDLREFKARKCYQEFAGRNAPCPECKVMKAQRDGLRSSWTSRQLFEGKEIEIRVLPNADKDQKNSLMVVHYRDVTLQKALHESLARADKLAALGKLAGGVAHEINSPLAGIMAFAQMALREMSTEDPHREDLKEIEAAAQKCKVIVEGLLGFARQDAPESVDVYDLVESVQSTLRLARVMVIKERIDLRIHLPKKPIVIEGSKGRISQVLLNLITNAIHAMRDGGGELEISVTETAEMVAITVRDTGEGIPPEILTKIFDPFFTTKPVGEGTGLGLAISYSIVTQHRGTITVESTLGIGSTFRVELPKYRGVDEKGEEKT